jgi:hypothetical protein
VGARDKSDRPEGSVPNTIAPGTSNVVAVEDAAPALSVALAPPVAQESTDVLDVPPLSPSNASASESPETVEGSVPNPVASSSTVPVEDAAPVPSVTPTTTNKIIATIDSDVLSSPVKDAKFYYHLGVAAYHNGDVALAIADFNLAIRLDPNFKNAYMGRAIAFYRISEFNRAFADMAQAMRIKNPRKIATLPQPKGRQSKKY